MISSTTERATRTPGSPPMPSLAALAVAALLAACATPPASAPGPNAATASPTVPPAAAASATAVPTGARAASAAASGAATAARPPAPGTPPPFAEVTRDAKSTPGYLTVWAKDDKTWIEIPAERLDQPMFFAASFASGLGVSSLLPGLMPVDQVVVLRRVGHSVQMVARNLHARAPEGTPLARAVAESYSDSLLAAAPLAAAPHPERKSLLVDAMALLGGDLAGLQTHLEASFRMPYGLDRGNSSVERTRVTNDAASLTLRLHFAVPKLPAPPVFAPGAPPPNPAALPNPPRVVPDPRSFFLSLAYTFAPLPATPMRVRLADQRVGYFTEDFVDFGDEFAGDRRTHYIKRWRLEKKDPTAAISEPKEPIRVVLDRNIPEKWRDIVRAGVLEWNQAFERAGWRNALAVEQQPADADWSTLDGAHLIAVRWFAMEGPGAIAVGPRQADPRSGEILRAAVIIPENWVRFERLSLADTEPRLPAAAANECSYATDMLEQSGFGLELLELRGAIEPDSLEARRYVAASLKETVTHEIGHALGLRHNFKASTGITAAQLRDPAFTQAHGTANSVMDYVPPNTPLEREAVADYFMPGLGAYDFWAIEYGYREFAPADEKAGLAALAARSASDKALGYATDEDTVIGDPLVNRFDLSDDPLAYAERQLALGRELWTRTQARALPADDDFTVYRRNLQRGLNRFGLSVPLLSNYVGGLYTTRALAGADQALITPVPAAKQRAALEVLLGEVFASTSFRFEPQFMSRLGTDQFDRLRGAGPSGTDFSLPTVVLSIQRSALDTLMSDAVALRLADAEDKVADPKTLLSYAELQQRLAAAVWSELDAKAPQIDLLRRNLQREHLKRLAAGLLRPASPVAADVRAVHRLVAQQLEARLKTALAARNWSATARAHLADSQAALAEAMRASVVKPGV
ncbi:MAG: zinc-dependent metalloprotease [Burkholderiales bacterium]|nr:zinc-dependent metalloprotease [Burkholderiales bacterium]